MFLVKKMRKILIICNSINPDLKMYFKLYSRIKNFDKILIGNRELDNVDYVLSISKKSIPTFKSILSVFFAVKLAFISEIRESQLAHFTTAHFDNLFFAIILRIFTKKRMIFTIHDKEPHPGMKRLFILFYNWVVEKYLADDVILFCRKYKNYSKKVKYYFQALSGFPHIIKKPKTGNYILFFGRIDNYKGLSILWRIAKLFPKQRFVVAGKGKNKYLEKMKKLDNVTVYNQFISNKEIINLFKGAKLTLLPYLCATQSGVIILSYSHATPVVTFSVGCLNEYVTNEIGWIFEPYEIDKVKKLLQSLKDEEIVRKSENITKIYPMKFSEDNFINEYTEILNKICLDFC